VRLSITINDLELRTIIGVLDFERKNAQRVILNIKLSYYYTNEYINYVDIKELVKSAMTENRYYLLEEALIDISNLLKLEFPNIETVYISIKKPDILDDCNVGVEIDREF